MKKRIAMLILLLPAFAAGFAQTNADSTVTFRFVGGEDMFYIPWAGNGAELERLYTLVDTYRTDITSGRMPVEVDGYCASLPTAKENLRTAYVRASRVKSQLITHKGLKEEHFRTGNYARPYGNSKDMVIVTMRIPKPVPEPAAEKTRPEERPAETVPVPTPVETAETHAEPAPAIEPAPEPAEPTPTPMSESGRRGSKPYVFAVRTNVLYDAMLLPSLGIEWRLDRNVGIRVDVSGSWWGDEHGKVQKIWLVNPEMRWYLLRNKCFYVGASANFGEANVYKYALGGILSHDTGYQGSFWGAGLTVGYQLPLSRCFSVDFNLGLGYTRFEYDTFGVTNEVRVYKHRNVTKNFWGPTQAGISLVWKIGGNK